jgi:N-methylhydantoinase A
MSFRIGIDVGGTFTDGILIDERTGDFTIAKVPSTPEDPSRGFLHAVERLLEEHPEAEWPDLDYIIHATTVVTNAVLEDKTAPAAFLVTEGFRDLLEIGRQTRSSLYDLQFVKARPMVQRRHVFEIPERLNAAGDVVRPLDEDRVRDIGSRLREAGIETVAVCLIHSYRNSGHERRVAELLREQDPGLLISLSCDIAPEFREYPRASTTVINAVVRPPVTRYLSRIQRQVHEAGAGAGLLMMQSNGGVTDFDTAAERPVSMVESGPAAGVIAARNVARLIGREDAFSFDMGGTTAKVGLIRDGEPRIVKDYEVGSVARASGRGGAGYPIRTPVIDLVEIGAGGGSIAWIDEGGSLRVGPRSAGADPGPACYGQGGEQPTVTDANVVLGYLDPGFFLGGEIELDVHAARKAIQRACATPLGLSTVEAAHGIVELANAAMANAFRLISVQRGYDPRDFLLVAFGGAGPLHANRLAQTMDVRQLAVPRSPGVYTSVGLVGTDLRRDEQVALLRPTEEIDWAVVTETFENLEKRGREALGNQGVAVAELRHRRQIDMRYVGQGYELTVDAGVGADGLAAVEAAFHAEHERAFGFAAAGEPTEVVNIRVATIGSIDRPTMSEAPAFNDPSLALKGTREAYFAELGGYVASAVYDRGRLGVGAVVEGPALLEEFDSTTVVCPGYRARVVEHGIVLVEPAA